MTESLKERCGGVCELCGSSEGVASYEVSGSNEGVDATVALCSTCQNQIESGELDAAHFNCLSDAMWSEVSAIKVLSYRLLTQLARQELLDMLYLEEAELAWAKAGVATASGTTLRYLDSNGVELQAGDTVVIIKDLPVKGAGFTAKRGTAVRNISLVPDDATHIEGRVNGVKIHILTQYLKKQ